jgi:alpha-L-fucosidase
MTEDPIHTMSLTRRNTLKLLAGAPSLRLSRATAADEPAIPSGPFRGTRESLRDYRIPDWYAKAKFGIWAHWGPQSAPEYGDWYARNMYIQGSRQYKYHLEHYGHPSKFGYKDVIPTWKAENFDPEHLIDLYKKAGAQYFVSMGVHHDNFDLWNSKHHRWNAAKMGPKRDIVSLFRKAALKRGLRFGISEHLAPSYPWFQTSHGSDKTGPYKGVPYDGVDPRYADLYHDYPETYQTPKVPWNVEGVPASWKRTYFMRIKDLIDQFEPDYLDTDGPIYFEEWGLALVAHSYNRSAKRHGGAVEAVWTSKRPEDCAIGTCVLECERGIVESIWPNPWQTATCIGNWHYDKEAKYKSPKIIIDMLVDTVSRNGNLLLNFPLKSDGTLDPEELRILSEITEWMSVNGEAIYDTRPWKIFGAGAEAPSTSQKDPTFNERNRKELTAGDLRFTRKGDTLYAFSMGWPENELSIRPLAEKGELGAGKIQNVELLGFKGKLQWTQDEAGLKVQMPRDRVCNYAAVLKVMGA